MKMAVAITYSREVTLVFTSTKIMLVQSTRMWDMSRFVMIVLLSLHRGETLSFGAYKLLVTHLSRDSSCYSGIYERRIRV